MPIYNHSYHYEHGYKNGKIKMLRKKNLVVVQQEFLSYFCTLLTPCVLLLGLGTAC